MVTKYDIFEIVYKNNEFIKPIEVVERLKKNKSEYKNIYRILNDLEKNKFLVKSPAHKPIRGYEK